MADYKTTEDGLFKENVNSILSSVREVLFEKNKKYGNSALQPMNVFSKKTSSNSILDRLDDKLSRIKNSEELRKNDVFDLLGYLILLCIQKGWTDFRELID